MIPRRSCRRLTLAVLLLTLAAIPACLHNKTPAKSDRTGIVDPIIPPADFVGAAPARFSWTPIPGATHYAMGIWNDVDTLVWRQDGIEATSLNRPEDLQLSPGTYYWNVVALTEADQQIATSGMMAFVVNR